MATQIAIVTGGRRGIGRGICEQLAASGFDLVVTDIEEDEAAAETVAAVGALGRRAVFLRADVGDLASHRSVIDAALQLGRHANVLVNNAGVSTMVRGDLLDLAPDSFDRCVTVNLRGAFFLSQLFAKTLIAHRPAEPLFSCIVNITSVNAEIVAINRGDYCMTKAAKSMMTKLLAARLAEEGINVYEVRPGMIRTEMTAPSAERYEGFLASGGVPIARWGMPSDVGKAVAMLANGGLDYTTGNAVPVDGGIMMYRL